MTDARRHVAADLSHLTPAAQAAAGLRMTSAGPASVPSGGSAIAGPVRR